MSQSQLAALAPIASALSDPERQRLYARIVLAGPEGLPVADLAGPAAERLARLELAGLVGRTADGEWVAVREQVFAEALRQREQSAEESAAALLKDGRITEMPVRPARRQALLEYLTARAFEPGVSYGEPEVNIALRQYWEDTSALRRYLVDARLLVRSADGREYRVAA